MEFWESEGTLHTVFNTSDIFTGYRPKDDLNNTGNLKGLGLLVPKVVRYCDWRPGAPFDGMYILQKVNLKWLRQPALLFFWVPVVNSDLTAIP